jgi:hypothetical protein
MSMEQMTNMGQARGEGGGGGAVVARLSTPMLGVCGVVDLSWGP